MEIFGSGRARLEVNSAKFAATSLGNFGSKQRQKMSMQDRFTDECKRNAVAQVVDKLPSNKPGAVHTSITSSTPNGQSAPALVLAKLRLSSRARPSSNARLSGPRGDRRMA